MAEACVSRLTGCDAGELFRTNGTVTLDHEGKGSATAKGSRILGHPGGETAFGGDTTGLIVDVDRIVGTVALAEGASLGWAFSRQEF